MAHHGDHRWPRSSISVIDDFVFLGHLLLFDILFLGCLGRMPHFLDHQNRGVLIKRLVDRDLRAHVHQQLDQLASLDRHQLGELADGDRLGHFDLALDRSGRLLETLFTTDRAGNTSGASAARALGLAALGLGRNAQLFTAVARGRIALALGCLALGLLLSGLARHFFLDFLERFGFGALTRLLLEPLFFLGLALLALLLVEPRLFRGLALATLGFFAFSLLGFFPLAPGFFQRLGRGLALGVALLLLGD